MTQAGCRGFLKKALTHADTTKIILSGTWKGSPSLVCVSYHSFILFVAVLLCLLLKLLRAKDDVNECLYLFTLKKDIYTHKSYPPQPFFLENPLTCVQHKPRHLNSYPPKPHKSD